MIDLQPVIVNLNCSDLHLKLYLAEFSQKMETLNGFSFWFGEKSVLYLCERVYVELPVCDKKQLVKKSYCTSVSLVLK